MSSMAVISRPISQCCRRFVGKISIARFTTLPDNENSEIEPVVSDSLPDLRSSIRQILSSSKDTSFKQPTSFSEPRQSENVGEKWSVDALFPSRTEPPLDDDAPFAQWLRRSTLIRLGEAEGRVVLGHIVHVQRDDLYIDFGGKFNCVCKRPAFNGQDYMKNKTVRVRLHDLELSSKFLGSEKDLTLLEADATLIGLHTEGNRSS